VLPDLPFAYDALAPVISSAQLEVHHQKHHAAYVKGLNDALDKIAAASAAGDTAAVRALCDALAFNYGGHVLHTLYWFSLQPGGPKAPEGQLAELITRDFGSPDALKRWLAAAAVAVQGSGWALLALDPLSGRLMVLQTEQHHKVLGWGLVPLLAIDVWEHAYYLDYQNRRADYVAAVMDIINWDVVGKRLSIALA
jgi:Fe-Mn family superoxide dismutase